MERPQAVLFDIGSTLWSSPAEDPAALAACYGRGLAVIEAAGLAPPAIEALIDAVEGHFAEWEDTWRTQAGLVEQPPSTEYVSRALERIEIALAAEPLAAFTEAILDTSVGTAGPPAPPARKALALPPMPGPRPQLRPRPHPPLPR